MPEKDSSNQGLGASSLSPQQSTVLQIAIEEEARTGRDFVLSAVARKYGSSVPNVKEIVLRLIESGHVESHQKGKYNSYRVVRSVNGDRFTREDAHALYLLSRYPEMEGLPRSVRSAAQRHATNIWAKSGQKKRDEQQRQWEISRAKKRLTKAQREVLESALRAQSKLARSPLLHEIAAERHQPPHVIAKHVQPLVDAEYLGYREDGSIRIFRGPSGTPVQPPSQPSKANRVPAPEYREPLIQVLETALEMARESDVMQIPILGTVAAGRPVESVSEVPRTIALPREWIRNRHAYALRVEGESMAGDGIHSGDLALVVEEPFDQLRIGSIWVCWIPGIGATIKRVRTTDEAAELIASNPMFLRVEAPEGTIVQGRVVKVVRDLE